MKYFISICAAFAIIGCGTNSDYKAQDGGIPDKNEKPDTQKPVIQTSYKDKGGLSGVVYGKDVKGKVCFDTNLNGKCDTSENSEQIFEDGKFSFEKSISDANKEQVLLAEIKNGDYLTSYTNNITPYTALVVNGVLYNPNNDGNIQKAKDFLSKKFDLKLLNGQMPDSKDAQDMYDTYQKAIKQDSFGVYDAIANSVNAFYKQNTYLPTISITKQKRANEFNGSEISLQDTSFAPISFTKTDGDETFMGSFSNGKNVLSYSRWHNSLRIIDVVNGTPFLKGEERFLDVSGERHDVDSSTGASEQILTKVVETNNDIVFALLRKKGSNTANGLGIYKANISSGIPNIKYAGVKGNDFYELNDGVDMGISGDKLAVATKSSVLIFNTNDITKPLAKKDISNIRHISFSGSYIIVSKNDSQSNNLEVLNSSLESIATLNTKNIVSSKSKSIYINAMSSYNNKLYFTLNDLSNEGFGNKIFCYDIENNTLISKKQLSASSGVKSINTSSNGKYLLVSTWDKKLEVYDTNSFIKTSTDLEKVGYDAYIISNDLVTLVYKDSVGFKKLSEKNVGITDSIKEAWINEHRK